MTLGNPSCRIVYLDQKCWIDLAKIFYGNPSESDRELLVKILRASEKERAIFPISMIHISETGSISKPRWRKELASLMVKISRMYTMAPRWGSILKLEIKNAVLRELGAPTIDIRRYSLGRGLSKLLEAIPEVVSEEIDPRKLEELNKQLLDVLDSPEALEFILKLGFDDSLRRELHHQQIEVVEKLESNRKNLQNIKDNELRRKAFLFQNTLAVVIPILAETLIEMELPKEFSHRIFPQSDMNKSHRTLDIDRFLERVPSALCAFALLFQRDQQLKRPIEVNDMADIWYLILAIPYCDIVVTEKMWASMAKRAKLDKKCSTLILSSIRELGAYL